MRVTGGAFSFSEWHKCIQWGVAVRFSVTGGRASQLGVRTLRRSSLLRLQHPYVPSASLPLCFSFPIRKMGDSHTSPNSLLGGWLSLCNWRSSGGDCSYRAT